MKTNNKNEQTIIPLILLMIPIGQGAIDIYAPAMPYIQKALETNHHFIQLTVITYIVFFGISKLFWGPFSDAFGRRTSLFIGSFIFIVGSFIAATSHSIEVLIFSRSIQAAGAACFSVMNKSIAVDVYSGKKLKIVTTYITMIWALAPITAPVIGGYLYSYFNWQACFYFLIIYCLLLIFGVLFFFKETIHDKKEFQLSTIKKDAIKIFKHKSFWNGVLCLSCINTIILSFNFFAPFLLTHKLNIDSITFGYISLIIGISYLIGTLINRFLIKYFEADNITGVAIILSLVTSLVLLVFSLFDNFYLYYLLTPCSILALLSGLVFGNCMAKVLSYFKKIAGMSSGIMGATFSLVSGIFMYILSHFVPTSLLPLAILNVFLSFLSLISFFAMKKT
ncbi:MAG: multidrug effflux MFS transporter [bacterium]|nr:multidrug effflux MFS transporter [bacterium]